MAAGRAPWAAPCSRATTRARGGACGRDAASAAAAGRGDGAACPWGTSARSSGGRPEGRPPRRHGGAGAGGGSGGSRGGAGRVRGAGEGCAAPSASCPFSGRMQVTMQGHSKIRIVNSEIKIRFNC